MKFSVKVQQIENGVVLAENEYSFPNSADNAEAAFTACDVLHGLVWDGISENEDN